MLIVVAVMVTASCGGGSAAEVRVTGRGYLYLRPVLCVFSNGPSQGSQAPTGPERPSSCDTNVAQSHAVTPKGHDVPSSNVFLTTLGKPPLQFVYALGPADATGGIVAHAEPHLVSAPGKQSYVMLSLTSHGLRMMRLISKFRERYSGTKQINRSLEAFDLNGMVISSPRFPEAWHGNRILLTGDYSKAVATRLADELNRAG